MTIEDGLDELEDKAGKQPKQPATQIAGTPEELAEDAKKVMGDFLAKFVYGELPGQKRFGGDCNYKDLITQESWDMLWIEPAKLKSQKKICNLQYRQNLHSDTVKAMLVRVAGPNALETDLVELCHNGRYDELKQKVPELDNLKKEILSNWDREIERATIHPLLFVFKMRGEMYGPTFHRQVAVMTVQSALESGSIKLDPDFKLNPLPEKKGIWPFRKTIEQELTEETTCNYIKKITPPTREFADVAVKYGATNQVAEVIDRYQEAQKVFLDHWHRNHKCADC